MKLWNCEIMKLWNYEIMNKFSINDFYLNIPLSIFWRLCLEQDNCVGQYNQLALKDRILCLFFQIGINAILDIFEGLGVAAIEFIVISAERLSFWDTLTGNDVIYWNQSQVSRCQILNKTIWLIFSFLVKSIIYA